MMAGEERLPPLRPTPALRCGTTHRQWGVRCVLDAHGPEVRHSAPVQTKHHGICFFSWNGP